ncbi:MAG TPA: ABC transporter ATP-binding protein [Chitinophagaceae bacterium]|nr:ABC transporter ATP-binding protein [Chitinophagaceae bacterium]
MKNSIIDLLELETNLKTRPEKAADQFIALVKEQASDPKIYFKALYLKSVLMASNSDEDRESTIQTILQLLAQIQPIQNLESKFQSLENQLKDNHVEVGTENKGEVVFECKNIGKDYGSFKLKEINLKLRLGEITGIVGENGNGKTTLLKIIAGELLPSEGEFNYGILNSNEAVTNWIKIKSNIAYLPQELMKHRGSVRRNIELAASLHGIKGEANEFEVDYILHRMGLYNFANHEWKHLSGGYKLRFALTQILVWKPKLIILDEPLANLDINAQMLVLNDLRDLANSIGHPISILLSSQNLEEVEAIANKMIILRKGEMQYYGNVDGIGKDRIENSFELRTNANLAEIKLKLSSMKYNRLDFNGFSYIIDVPLEIDAHTFISYCSAQEIPISYFNDISSSSKRILFNNRLYA